MDAASRSHAQKEAGRAVARILLEIEAVNFRPEEPYILTSGRASPVYIDCRKVIAYPRARRRIVELARQCIEREIGTESLTHVAGGETARYSLRRMDRRRSHAAHALRAKEAQGFWPHGAD